MSFFGFDTSLPRDKGSSKPKQQQNDPFDPTNEQDEDDDAAFEEKLRGLTAGAQEDVEIYTWGGGGEGGYDGLGDLLDEAGDDLNDDTFGFGGGDVGKDFDFSGTGGKSTTTTSTLTGLAGSKKSKTNDAAFASTLDDFWFMPEVKSATPTSQPTSGVPFASGNQLQQQQQQQQAPVPVPAPAPAPKTLEEIEAELRASHQKQKSIAVPVVERLPLTLEEVEAEMLARRKQPPPPSSALPPPEVSAMMQQFASEQGQQGNSSISLFPPLGSKSPTRSQAASTAASTETSNQQAHFARLRSLLEALPPPLQGRILNLAPYMQFGAVESIAREFPALTVAGRVEKLPQQIENPKLWPRADGSAEEVGAIRSMIEVAFSRLDEAEQMERKRHIRLAKISAMSKYNNLMTLSDKDFITRIQVSQLVTSDPYTDDFYAHIYTALRGGTNSGLMGKQPMNTDQKPEAAAAAPTPAKGGRQRKQQTSRRETAMMRMQQQVERIVQNRKDRIEKSTQGVALEGALGRVSLSSTKTPRQMLQVDALKEEPNGTRKGEEEGTGHAQDAVRQALKGASLGNDQSGQQKRPPLTKLEVLSILENLYDLVLSLEQSRRNAPANANEGDDAEVTEWRNNRENLTAKLWKELRVLEPLEISDPHPFVSLLSTIKGKRLLPRVLRHLSTEQTLTAMTMIVASFDTLDVVRESVLLDEASSNRNNARLENRKDAQRQTEAFATSIVPSMLTLMTTAPMQIVSGMLALFIERNDPVRAAQSKAGIAFLTIFLSRAETLRQQAATDGPSASELTQWSEIFNLLVQRLTYSSTQLSSLFPSTRAKMNLPFGSFIDLQQKDVLEVEDQDVWQLMAALAVGANMNQQQLIVTGLREKILENVLEAKQWQANNLNSISNDQGDIRIRNVNLLLHALGLDAAQITV